MPNRPPVPVTPMSVQDQLWLNMDRPNNLMVVDGVILLDGPVGLEAVRNVFRDAVEKFPVLSCRAVTAGGSWVWESDPDFAVARQVIGVEVPAQGEGPVDMAAIQAYVSQQRAVPFDKEMPLWAVHVSPVVLSDGHEATALCTRFHHAIGDGVRLTQFLLGLCQAEDVGVGAVVSRGSKKAAADSTDEDPGDPVTPGRRAAMAEVISGIGQALAHAASRAAAEVPAIPSRVVDGVAESVSQGASVLRHPERVLDVLDVLGVPSNRPTNDMATLAKLAVSGSDPTHWTGEPGHDKTLAWTEPFPLEPVKAVCRATGTTVNDVLIAAVAGALRGYLQERDGLVDLIQWMVPVNLKPFDPGLPADLGNYFAVVYLPMPLTDSTPEERLARMNQEMNRIKNSDEAIITFGLQRLVSMSPTQVSFQLTNFFANRAIGVLTNVPGPRGRLTFADVPVKQVIGFAPCSGDQPMTASIFTYNGTVTIGFATDAKLLPEAEELVARTKQEVDALVATCAPTS